MGMFLKSELQGQRGAAHRDCLNLPIIFFLSVSRVSDSCSGGHSSREDLEVNGILEETCILDELDHFLLSVGLNGYLCQVLAEEFTALTAEQLPQELNEWLAEEDQALLAAVLKVDLEVVLNQRVGVWAQLFLEPGRNISFTCYLRRLHDHVQSQLRAFFLQKLFGDSEHLPKKIALLCFSVVFLQIVAKLLHDSDLYALAELPYDGLPEGINLDSLCGHFTNFLLTILGLSVADLHELYAWLVLATAALYVCYVRPKALRCLKHQ